MVTTVVCGSSNFWVTLPFVSQLPASIINLFNYQTKWPSTAFYERKPVFPSIHHIQQSLIGNKKSLTSRHPRNQTNLPTHVKLLNSRSTVFGIMCHVRRHIINATFDAINQTIINWGMPVEMQLEPQNITLYTWKNLNEGYSNDIPLY